MQMMYQVIAKEIKSMQLDAHPEDYLNFYCLGNRESIEGTPAQVSGDTDKVVFLEQELNLLPLGCSILTYVESLIDKWLLQLKPKM